MEGNKDQDREDNYLLAMLTGVDLSEEDEAEEDEEVFFLWTSNQDIFNIYQTIRAYLGEGLQLCGANDILLALIKDKDLPITHTLESIPSIHGGYSSLLRTYQESKHGNKDT